MSKNSAPTPLDDKRFLPPILAADGTNLIAWRDGIKGYMNLQHGQGVGDSMVAGKMVFHELPPMPLQPPPVPTQTGSSSAGEASIAAAQVHAAATAAAQEVPAANTRGGNNAAALAAQAAANAAAQVTINAFTANPTDPVLIAANTAVQQAVQAYAPQPVARDSVEYTLYSKRCEFIDGLNIKHEKIDKSKIFANLFCHITVTGQTAVTRDPDFATVQADKKVHILNRTGEANRLDSLQHSLEILKQGTMQLESYNRKYRAAVEVLLTLGDDTSPKKRVRTYLYSLNPEKFQKWVADLLAKETTTPATLELAMAEAEEHFNNTKTTAERMKTSTTVERQPIAAAAATVGDQKPCAYHLEKTGKIYTNHTEADCKLKKQDLAKKSGDAKKKKAEAAKKKKEAKANVAVDDALTCFGMITATQQSSPTTTGPTVEDQLLAAINRHETAASTSYPARSYRDALLGTTTQVVAPPAAAAAAAAAGSDSVVQWGTNPVADVTVLPAVTTHTVNPTIRRIDAPHVALLDSGSTAHIVRDEDLFSSRAPVEPSVLLRGIGPDAVPVSDGGILPGFGFALYVPAAPCNIISFGRARDTHHMRMSRNGHFLLKALHAPTDSPGYRVHFKLNNEGLPIAKLKVPSATSTVLTVSEIPQQIPPLVADTPAARRRIVAARALHYGLDHPSDDVLCRALDAGAIIDTPVTSADVRNLRRIEGPCPGCVLGRMSTPPACVSVTASSGIIGHTLHCDVLFVRGPKRTKSPFLLCVEGETNYIVIVKLTTQTQSSYEHAQSQVVRYYYSHSHTVKEWRCDREGTFAATEPHLHRLGVHLFQAAAGQHNRLAERMIQHIKAKARATRSQLSFPMPRRLNKYLLEHCVSSANTCPNSKTGTRSPREIVTGVRTSAHRFVRAPFGTVVVTPIPAGQRSGDSLAPTSEIGMLAGRDINGPGAVKIFIPTRGLLGHMVTRFAFKVMGPQPLFNKLMKIIHDEDAPDDDGPATDTMFIDPDAAADFAEDATAAEDVTPAGNPASPGDPPDGSSSADEEADATPDEAPLRPEFPVPGPSSETAGPPVTADASPPVPPILPSLDRHAPPSRGDSMQDGTEDHYPDVLLDTDFSDVPDLVEPDSDPTTESPPPPAGGDVAAAPPLPPPPHRYNLRSRGEQVLRLTVKQAIDKFGAAAEQSIEKELRQLVDLDVFSPVRRCDLASLQARKIIPGMLFLKDKYLPNGTFEKLKSRFVAGGHRQDRSLSPYNSSPTIDFNNVRLALALAAFLMALIVVLDVPTAFLHADGPEYPHGKQVIKIAPEMVALLRRWFPTKFTAEYLERDGSMLMEVNKALYGMIESALLWYQNLADTLTKAGFTALESDKCFFMKRTGTDFCFICVHVDDLLVCSSSQSMVDSLVAVLEQRYGKPTCHSGDTVYYLGLQIDNDRANGRVCVTQNGYTQEILDLYRVTGTAKTPANANLFSATKVDNPAAATVDPPLAERTPKEFLSRVMKLMFLATRTRPDILPVMTYLATFVTKPTDVQWRALDRVLRYLNGTKGLGLVLQPNDTQIVASSDASHNSYWDTRSVTGALAQLGTNEGALLFAISQKQKEVAGSSCVAELIAGYKLMPPLLQLKRTLEELGFPQKPIPVYQDNRSTILLSYRGEGTVQRTKHINLRYFYVKHLLDTDVIDIIYRETKKMTSDILSKPLVGQLFFSGRTKLLGGDTRDLITTSDATGTQTTQGCVGLFAVW